LLRRPVTNPSALASANLLASSAEPLSPTFCQPLIQGRLSALTGKVAMLRAAYSGCHFEKTPLLRGAGAVMTAPAQAAAPKSAKAITLEDRHCYGARTGRRIHRAIFRA